LRPSATFAPATAALTQFNGADPAALKSFAEQPLGHGLGWATRADIEVGERTMTRDPRPKSQRFQKDSGMARRGLERGHQDFQSSGGAPDRRADPPANHIQLATDALDEIRREVWNEARRAGQTAVARDLKGARFALWKNPEHLTARQRLKLADIQHTNRRLYRAYLLKKQLRQIYRLPAGAAIALLDAWLAWARRCRPEPFRRLAKTVTEQRAGWSPRSSTGSPTPASRPSTPRSASSPAAPSASTPSTR